MQHTKSVIIVALHIAPPLLAGWAAHLWQHGHEGIAIWLAVVAWLATLAAVIRDFWLDELVEALSPTRLYHGGTAIEPPRPLPAFTVEESPSRIRMRPVVQSVAPEDAANEQTETDRWVS